MKHQDLIDKLMELAEGQKDNLKFQKTFTNIVKQQVNLERRIEAKAQPYIKKYADDYAQNFKSYVISNEPRLLKEMIDSDLVYIGDFHPLKESKEVLHNLLQQLLGRKRKITLAMELVRAKHQQTLESYISGELTELGFLRKVEYWSDWHGVPWDYYKPIFDLAKANKGIIKLIGLDSNRDGYNCYLRDYHAAKTISRAAIEEPDRLVIAFMGDLHVARQHFPEKTNKQLASLGEKKKSVIVYQNRSRIYWDLMATKQLSEGTTVAQLSDWQNCSEYCLLSASPVDKCISYLRAGLPWFSKPKEVLENIREGIVKSLVKL